MKKPCSHCPYRNDIKPFLTEGRMEELAYITENPYNMFYCHKTIEYNDEVDDMVATDDSKLCAGFLSMQKNQCGSSAIIPETFDDSEWYEIVFDDPFDMIHYFEDEEDV